MAQKALFTITFFSGRAESQFNTQMDAFMFGISHALCFTIWREQDGKRIAMCNYDFFGVRS